MDKLTTRYWLPLLVIALFVAVSIELSSVEKIDLGRERVIVNPTAPQEQVVQKITQKTDSSLAVGQRFDSLDDLVNNQLAAGFVRTGYFGKNWPATVTEIALGRDQITFVRRDGTRHNYTKFNGYDMKMVRLAAGEKETIVVFRSQQRR